MILPFSFLRGRPKIDLHSLAFSALLLITLVNLFFFIGTTRDRLRARFPISIMECNTSVLAWHAANGRAIYWDYYHDRPILSAPYGIFFYGQGGIAARVTGLSDYVSTLRLCRALVFVYFLLALAACLHLALRRGAPRAWIWLVVAPAVWFPYPFEWSGKFAPDLMAEALSLAGWALLRPPRKIPSVSGTESAPPIPVPQVSARAFPGWPRVAGALTLWLLAFHTKPNLITGPVAWGIESLWPWLTLRDERRGGMAAFWSYLKGPAAMGAALLILAASSSWVINRATDGMWNLNAMRFNFLWDMQWAWMKESFRNLGATGILLLGIMTLWAVVRARHNALYVAFLVLLACQCFFILKRGSNVNYLCGPVLIWGVASAVEAARLRTESALQSPASKTKLFASLLAIVGTLLLASNLDTARKSVFEIQMPRRSEFADADAFLRNAPPSSIYCIDVGYALMRQLPYFASDPFFASMLVQLNKVDTSREEEALRTQKYDYVVSNRYTRADVKYHGLVLYPPHLLRALEERYEIGWKGRWLVIWQPRRTASSNHSSAIPAP